eukprot:1112635-Amorphochlora_amoeboformis.AAC.1
MSTVPSSFIRTTHSDPDDFDDRDDCFLPNGRNTLVTAVKKSFLRLCLDMDVVLDTLCVRLFLLEVLVSEVVQFLLALGDSF